MPKVSIIMPVYNGEQYLNEAIDSILAQTFEDWELIIINEYGSNEIATNILHGYDRVDKRIKILQNLKKLGISASLNRGIDAAGGEYIARMDGDDIALPDRLAKQVEYLDSHLNIGMCGSRIHEFGARSINWKIETDEKQLSTDVLFYSPCVHPTVMIRKEILTKNNLYYNPEFSATEDYDLFSRISSVSQIANIDEVLLNYRINGTNATFTNNDIGIKLYAKVMSDQFHRLGLVFSSDEVDLLSPHISLKNARGDEVYHKLIELDLLLKKILVANDKCERYDTRNLSHTLHKRFKEAYESVAWQCKDFEQKKVNMIYKHSIFANEYFYEGYQIGKGYNPVISVLMPTYNSEKYVAETVLSVLEQDFKNFEFLVVNEYGSDDDTIRIIRMFRDERIRIIQNDKKLGLAESLNLGMREARGKYIARIDADDICCKGRLRTQYEFMESNPEYGVCGGWQHHFGLDTDWFHRPPVFHEEIKAHLIYRCELCHSTLMLRKDFFLNNNLLYDGNYAAEDYELWTRAVHKFKFANIPQILGEYRVGLDNITAQKMDILTYESGELAYRNITEHLKVKIPGEHIKYLASWRNEFTSLKNKKEYAQRITCEKRILTDMWNNNKRLNVYEDQSLLYVINQRWLWINYAWKHGTKLNTVVDIKELFKRGRHINISFFKIRSIKLAKLLKKAAKKCLKPFYAPLKQRLFDRLDQIRQQIWDMDGHLIDYRNSINEHTDIKQTEISCKLEKLEDSIVQIDARVTEAESTLSETIHERINDAVHTLMQTTDARIWRAEEAFIQRMDGRVWDLERRVFEKVKQYDVLLDNITMKSEMLFINDTFNTYHHGCSGTSLALRRKLTELSGNDISSIPWTIVRYARVAPKSAMEFASEEFRQKWINENQDLVYQIKLCKKIVLNGEGSISNYNPGTLNLLYVLYIAKKVYGKDTYLINSSLYPEDKFDNISQEEQEEFKKMIGLTIESLSFCCLRDPISFGQIKKYDAKNCVLGFDCLPLYIKEVFLPREKQGTYVTISGGNSIQDWYVSFVAEFLNILPGNYEQKKVIFLYSNVPYAEETNDMEVYRSLKQQLPQIELHAVDTIDQWLAVINDSSLFISGRFHHTIASYMLDTPFFAFKADSYKIEGILETMQKSDSLLARDDIKTAVNKARELLDKPEYASKNPDEIKEQLIELANRNFDFLR